MKVRFRTMGNLYERRFSTSEGLRRSPERRRRQTHLVDLIKQMKSQTVVSAFVVVVLFLLPLSSLPLLLLAHNIWLSKCSVGCCWFLLSRYSWHFHGDRCYKKFFCITGTNIIKLYWFMYYNQCDQIGLLLKVIGNSFSYKIIANMW